MDGFLVIGRTTLDDVPMRLYGPGERAEAERWAAHLTEDHVKRALAQVFNVDVSTVHSIVILEFKGGLPLTPEYVTDFT